MAAGTREKKKLAFGRRFVLLIANAAEYWSRQRLPA
jgi:hypothetical protein